MKLVKQLLTSPYFYIFLLSYYGVWLMWDALRLPYHGPEGVISYLPSIHYNPTNNILRFMAAVLVPPLACLAFWLLSQGTWHKKFMTTKWHRALSVGLILAALLMSCFMGMVQGSTDSKNQLETYGGPYSHALLDTFHEGETLGPAVSYEQKDLKPYRDFVIIHGVFQDPLRTVIAFKLFGKSIGASRAFAVMLLMATFALYYLLLLTIFRGNLYKSSAGLAVLGLLLFPAATLPFIGSSLIGVWLPFRDIPTILFLIAAILGIRATLAGRLLRHSIFSFVVGFIVSVGFANSIDRAMYITVLSMVWLWLVFLVRNKGFFKGTFLPYVLGGLTGIPVVGWVLKWAFVDFARYLLSMSKYKEYLDGVAFKRPEIGVSIILLAASISIFAVGYYLLRLLSSARLKKGTSKQRLLALKEILAVAVREHYVTILLFFTALFFLRSAIGRADVGHFIYSIQWIYLLLTVVAINYLSTTFKRNSITLGFISILLFGFTFIYYAGQAYKIDTGKDTFPINVSDEKFMRTDYVETAKYLKENLGPHETFMTLTSEGSWYYFADKPSPTRWYVLWYAFTKPQREEAANTLATNTNIKYVLTNNNWTSNFDYVPNNERFPEVYEVLSDKYTPHKGIGQQTIWIRK